MTDSTQAVHLLGERGREELLDLLLVDRLAAGRDGARGLAARVERVLALVVLRLVGRGLDARADVSPRAVVERLLLAPEDVRVGVLVEVGRDLERRFVRGIKQMQSMTRNIPGRRGTARSARHG